MAQAQDIRTALQFEVVEAKESISGSDWIVEAIDRAGDGDCFVARFTGPYAEQRAREYAGWKNSAGGREF